MSQWLLNMLIFGFGISNGTLLEPSSETANLNGQEALSTCEPNFLTCNEHQ